MLRKVLFSLVGGLAIVLCAASPALAEDATPKVERRPIQATLDEKSEKMVRQLEMKNVETGRTFRPFADPPGGGCEYPLGFEGFANYTNGTLSAVNLSYFAQVWCYATAPNQNLAGIIARALLWKDGVNVDEAEPGVCTDCLVSPVSSDLYACGGVGCAGGYWSANLFALKAPDGWFWNGVPNGCIGNPPYVWIECAVTTGVDTVPPVM